MGAEHENLEYFQSFLFDIQCFSAAFLCHSDSQGYAGNHQIAGCSLESFVQPVPLQSAMIILSLPDEPHLESGEGLMGCEELQIHVQHTLEKVLLEV